jgi:hypothetical protein
VRAVNVGSVMMPELGRRANRATRALDGPAAPQSGSPDPTVRTKAARSRAACS